MTGKAKEGERGRKIHMLPLETKKPLSRELSRSLLAGTLAPRACVCIISHARQFTCTVSAKQRSSETKGGRTPFLPPSFFPSPSHEPRRANGLEQRARRRRRHGCGAVAALASDDLGRRRRRGVDGGPAGGGDGLGGAGAAGGGRRAPIGRRRGGGDGARRGPLMSPLPGASARGSDPSCARRAKDGTHGCLWSFGKRRLCSAGVRRGEGKRNDAVLANVRRLSKISTNALFFLLPVRSFMLQKKTQPTPCLSSFPFPRIFLRRHSFRGRDQGTAAAVCVIKRFSASTVTNLFTSSTSSAPLQPPQPRRQPLRPLAAASALRSSPAPPPRPSGSPPTAAGAPP